MMTLKKTVTINSRKFDEKIHRSWQCELVNETNEYFIFVGVFDREITHKDLGVIRRGTVSYEYYRKKSYFNIFQFFEPNGSFRNFYGNICTSPKLENNVVDYVDLDIDVLVWKDFSFEILDLDEYEQNCQTYNYSTALQIRVAETLAELIKKIQIREFPFDDISPKLPNK